ncbi:MAG: hypothetical protein QME68_08575, partial [Elusimicrobiota bacterium]|nr:hypothetical protein [Elusimicrobiota bacterium]
MNFEPAYLQNSGKLNSRIEQLKEILKACRLCPRKCEVDRTLATNMEKHTHPSWEGGRETKPMAVGKKR